MVQCFVPDCLHQSESHTCRYFRFPDEVKEKSKRNKWISLIRREDKAPNKHSRVCSCHFRLGNKDNGPELFDRNKHKLFDAEPPAKRRKTVKSVVSQASTSIADDETSAVTSENTQVENNDTGSHSKAVEDVLNRSTTIILEHSLQNATQEVSSLKTEIKYNKHVYSVHNITAKVLRMETGLPTRKIFNIVVDYVNKFKDSIVYFQGWQVTCIKLEDQVFLTLMKMRQNYTNLHLATIFGCSETTVANVVMTFLHVLHKLLAEDIMSDKCPSRQKNHVSAPLSFMRYPNCKMIIDCTDFPIAIPKDMDKQKATYSSYRSMNSFKALVGVSPNGVITYVSKLYPGSVSDKAIVQNCGILSLFTAGDLILADKGFLIEDIIPSGVTVNIPPFLQNAKFTDSEIKLTKEIASCRIHVERANQRLKDFKILSFIPPMLRDKSDIVLQLVAALVNLQFPIIKEASHF